MPLARAEDFRSVLTNLSVLRYIVRSNSKKGHYDLNKQCETFFRGLINRIEDWNLVVMERVQKNYPAIDLGDAAVRVCVQVSADSSSAKIKKTVSKFELNKLYRTYDRLVFLSLTEKRRYRSTLAACASKFKFNLATDIWDVDDILDRIEGLETPRIAEIREYVQREVGNVISTAARPGSVFASSEQRACRPPLNAKRFFDALAFEEEEKPEELKRIKKVYAKLASLPRDVRGFLAVIIDKGELEHHTITILGESLSSFTKHLGEKRRGFFKALEKAGFASVDDDNRTAIVRLHCSLGSGVDFFQIVKEFCEQENVSLKDLIEDADFGLLDDH